MGRTWAQMRSEMRKAEKGRGRPPKLGVGTYKLLITGANLIRTEESKNETNPDEIMYQGMGVTFKVLEGSGVNPVGSNADWPFWTEANEGWKRKKNWEKLRAFFETVMGEDITSLGDDCVDELPGFVVFAQVELNDAGYPEISWSHVAQTVEDVLARRKELEE